MNKSVRILLVISIVPLLMGLMENLGTLKLRILNSNDKPASEVVISLASPRFLDCFAVSLFILTATPEGSIAPR